MAPIGGHRCGFMEPERTLITRIDEAVAALRARPEKVIAIFGHSDWFNFLMERHCGVSDYWLENAECYVATLPPAEPEQPMPPEPTAI